jgi:hypothetical protein
VITSMYVKRTRESYMKYKARARASSLCGEKALERRKQQENNKLQ